MLIRFEERDHWLIARPEVQRLDSVAAPEFGAAMSDRCGDRSHIVLDLTEVKFIDSRGLAALVSLFKSLAPESTLRLAHVSDQVEILLKMTRLNKLMSIHGDIDAALTD